MLPVYRRFPHIPFFLCTPARAKTQFGFGWFGLDRNSIPSSFLIASYSFEATLARACCHYFKGPRSISNIPWVSFLDYGEVLLLLLKIHSRAFNITLFLCLIGQN